jgi:putative membrane protein
VLEGRLHPLAVLLIARRSLSASIVPLLALLISLGTRVLVPFVLAAIFLGLPLALLAWWRFTYRVADGRLEVRSGVISRTTRIVPLDRVRGVDVTAPFLHRLLGLVRVEVEAAAGGGKQAELTLAAVSREQADALREQVLAREPVAPAAVPKPPIYETTPRSLALAGVTSGRYLLAPAAIVGVVVNVLDDLPGGVFERAAQAAVDRAPSDFVGIALVSAGAILLVLAFAVAGSLIVDWDFTLAGEGERLTATRGLLTRRTVSIDRSRIRGLDVRDTPLRRPLRLATVAAIAGGVRGSRARTVLAPVVSREGALRLIRDVDPDAPDPSEPLDRHPHAARRRRLPRALGVPGAALVVFFALGWWWAVAGAAALCVLAVPLALDRYAQLGHNFDGRRLALREGSLDRRWSELDPSGIVAFQLRRSPGQLRAGVGTLVLYLGEGAGSRRALDLGDEQARELLRAIAPEIFEPLIASG